ncbi:MAG: hypothetical protein BET99_03085 [Marine Group III euryarchaeote CG-Epi2]|uniref:Uncharacterized protein n=1 Tax=Marine Group III euryarchaeote CG-Epi2 TaxID=1888996 RepID=A0A1J5TPV6_9ARCH|nr:MAG: hypothetical protein BET99_03085 [Marine Group III euryarchaeote CG-Epi2]|tara:strand:+ start:985 stop:1677 length:693 start_codon:yes stop_codon:yes gene_type:complete
MSKKKGKREEIFSFPEFNKEEYRVKETRDSIITIFSVFYALIIAVICYSLVRMTPFGGLVMYIGFASPFGLIKILPLFFDTSEFERKNWVGPMMMSFMAWLGIFILLSNPPFNDIAKPKFQQVDTFVEMDGQWNETEVIGIDTPFVLVISVKDNWGVDEVQFSASKGTSGFLSAQVMEKVEADNEFGIEGNSLYYYYFENGLDVASYTFVFTASDAEGNSNSRTSFITIG